MKQSQSDSNLVRAPKGMDTEGKASASGAMTKTTLGKKAEGDTHKAEGFLRRYGTLNENTRLAPGRGYGLASFSFHENAVASWLRMGAEGIKKPPVLKKHDTSTRKRGRMTYIPPRDINKSPESVAEIYARRNLKLVYSHIMKTLVDPYHQEVEKAVFEKDPKQRTRDTYLNDDPIVRSALASTVSTVSSTPMGSARLEPYLARLDPYHKPNKALTELSKGCLGSPWTYGLVNDYVEARIKGLTPVLEGLKRDEMKSSWRKSGDGAAAAIMKSLPYSWSRIEPLPITNH